jgi:hypothetical protein
VAFPIGRAVIAGEAGRMTTTAARPGIEARVTGRAARTAVLRRRARAARIRGLHVRAVVIRAPIGDPGDGTDPPDRLSQTWSPDPVDRPDWPGPATRLTPNGPTPSIAPATTSRPAAEPTVRRPA